MIADHTITSHFLGCFPKSCYLQRVTQGEDARFLMNVYLVGTTVYYNRAYCKVLLHMDIRLSILTFKTFPVLGHAMGSVTLYFP